MKGKGSSESVGTKSRQVTSEVKEGAQSRAGEGISNERAEITSHEGEE